MNQEKIGKFIAAKRKEKNMTQKQLALKIGVTDRAISKWERGCGCPDVSLLDEVSKALDISVVELLRGENIEYPEILEKDLIESMKYSKETTKQKIKSVVNHILVTIIIVLSFFIIICNIINSYKLNQTFNISSSIDKNDYENISKIEEYSNTILNHQGRYSDEDYEMILKYIEKTKRRLNNDTKNYLLKDTYSVKDIFKFHKYYKDVLYENYWDNKSLYYMLIHYDIDKAEHMIDYYVAKQNIDRNYHILYNIVNSSYQYKNDLSQMSALYVFSIVTGIYKNEVMLLKDIIEVGDLYA